VWEETRATKLQSSRTLPADVLGSTKLELRTIGWPLPDTPDLVYVYLVFQVLKSWP